MLCENPQWLKEKATHYFLSPSIAQPYSNFNMASMHPTFLYQISFLSDPCGREHPYLHQSYFDAQTHTPVTVNPSGAPYPPPPPSELSGTTLHFPLNPLQVSRAGACTSWMKMSPRVLCMLCFNSWAFFFIYHHYKSTRKTIGSDDDSTHILVGFTRIAVNFKFHLWFAIKLT